MNIKEGGPKKIGPPLMVLSLNINSLLDKYFLAINDVDTGNGYLINPAAG